MSIQDEVQNVLGELFLLVALVQLQKITLNSMASNIILIPVDLFYFQEEAELRSDGTKSTIKPSHVSPGRITCTRG